MPESFMLVIIPRFMYSTVQDLCQRVNIRYNCSSGRLNHNLSVAHCHRIIRRAMRSIAEQSVKIRKILAKISTILLKLDCIPLEQSKCLNETLCHYKIGDAIYHITNIVEKYDKVKKDIFLQCDVEINDKFEEYLVLSIRRIDYLKTIARRLSAVADNITKVYNDIIQENEGNLDADSIETNSSENIAS